MELLSEAGASRGRVTLRTLLRVRMLLGLYSAVSHRAALRVLARLYCLCLAYANTTLLITKTNELDIPFINFLPLILYYITNVLISLFTGDKYLFNFCKIIEQADAKMELFCLPLMTPPIKILFLFICAARTAHAILLLCTSFNTRLQWIITTSTIMDAGADLNCVMHILSVDLLRSRLVSLQHMLKFNVKRHRRDVHRQIKTIYDCLQLYKTMIDQFNANFSWPKLQIIVRMACTFTLLLINGSFSLLNLKNSSDTASSTFSTFVAIFLMGILSCLPAMFVELAIREVDKLKIAVGNLLLECDEDPLRAELELAAEYLDLRTFKVSVLRVCTIDGALVLTFFGLCTTYFIVVIQIIGVI